MSRIETFYHAKFMGNTLGAGRGYFTIPYDYLTNPKLATDAWAILSISK